ncbi:MAG: hypothetical protein R3319_04560, partial [Candidatus Bathyarchaeia archaeon]|nr:hypothetical protein [Candidatus Bathyarchaeia archaeon]
PTAFEIQFFVVSLAIILPDIETVSKMNIIESNTIIRILADPRRNRLLDASLNVIPIFDSGFNLSPVLKPKYSTDDRSFAGEARAASSIGFVPKVMARTKKMAKTSGANHKFGGFWYA